METETNASANEFKTLKCEYSFDAAKLKDQFIETNSQAFVNYISYSKFLSLIRFRNYCFKDPDLPDVFVTYDDSNPTSMEKNIINVLQNIKPYQSNQSLSDIIVSAYPDSQSAIQYFVYSTFPSIYGFFCCDEYSEQALNFLLLHFDDSLLPKLIGTFLMHSFIFQDRFIHLFFHSLSPKQIDFDEDYISDLFIYTLRRCISCFSRQQIQIVKKLIDTDKEKAKEAIFDEFLIPFISLWDIHPLYASTNIIIRISPPETPNDFISVKISNKLISLLNNMLSKDLCEEVFGAFYTRIYTILPEIQQIIFYGGLDFQFSNADIIISTKLYQSIRKKIDTNTNGNKFFNDAFHMKTFNIAVIPKIRPPDPNEPTKEITINKLQDNKTSREFLLNHSHGLREIQTMVESLKHIMRLFIDHYAMYQMAYREDNYPITFIKTQIENLSLNMLNIFVRTSKNLLEYVEKQTNSEFPNNQLSSIRFVIDGYLQENMPLHEIVVNSAITLQNKWANMYNDDVNNKTRINLSIIKDNSFMNKMEFYFNNFNDITLSLIFAVLSKTPLHFKGIAENNRSYFLSSLIDACSIVTPYSLKKDSIDANDPIISIRIPMLKDIARILKRAEKGFKALFENNAEMFFIGEKIRLFLEIERRLEPEFKSLPKNDRNLDHYQKIISPLFNYKEPLYFRASLIQALVVIRELYTDNYKKIPNLNSIRNPISPEIFEKFENMRKWFGISDRFYREFA